MRKSSNLSSAFLISQVGLDTRFTNASTPGIKMLTVCIAFSCYQITYYNVKHNSLESNPPLSGSLSLHHKILPLGHYGCLLLVYFRAGYLGTSQVFDWSDLAPALPVKILSTREGFVVVFCFFFLHLTACNMQFSSNLIQKEMQNMPITKLLQSVKVYPISQVKGLTFISLWMNIQTSSDSQQTNYATIRQSELKFFK